MHPHLHHGITFRPSETHLPAPSRSHEMADGSRDRRPLGTGRRGSSVPAWRSAYGPGLGISSCPAAERCKVPGSPTSCHWHVCPALDMATCPLQSEPLRPSRVQRLRARLRRACNSTPIGGVGHHPNCGETSGGGGDCITMRSPNSRCTTRRESATAWCDDRSHRHQVMISLQSGEERGRDASQRS